VHGEAGVSELRPYYGSDLPDGVPCKHPGCLAHITHPCEGCGRVGGRRIPPLTILASGMKEIRCACGTFLGFEVGVGENARMMIGNHLVREITSVCSDCHKEFHWKAEKGSII